MFTYDHRKAHYMWSYFLDLQTRALYTIRPLFSTPGDDELACHLRHSGWAIPPPQGNPDKQASTRLLQRSSLFLGKLIHVPG